MLAESRFSQHDHHGARAGNADLAPFPFYLLDIFHGNRESAALDGRCTHGEACAAKRDGGGIGVERAAC
jgi:hypothetical protein